MALEWTNRTVKVGSSLKNRIQNVYIVLGEEEGDFTMEPKAAVIVLTNGQFRVYSVRAEHNRLRTMMNRNSWADLENGVQVRGDHYRLQSHMPDMTEKGWLSVESIPDILVWLRQSYPLHLFFLDQHIAAL